MGRWIGCPVPTEQDEDDHRPDWELQAGLPKGNAPWAEIHLPTPAPPPVADYTSDAPPSTKSTCPVM